MQVALVPSVTARSVCGQHSPALSPWNHAAACEPRQHGGTFPIAVGSAVLTSLAAVSGSRRHPQRRGGVAVHRRQKGLVKSSVAAEAGATMTGGKTANVGAVLLSAGVGKRMGVGMPKQYLKLVGLEIALRSLEAFLSCGDLFAEVVIVCAEEYRGLFQEHLARREGPLPVIKYAAGGAERQDSVENGLAELTTEFAAIHDAARPLVTRAEIEKVVADAKACGSAALLAVQTKATIKQAAANEEGEVMVGSTPERKTMWEAHTPQVVRCDLLRRGFQLAAEESLAVTDDVSLVEFLGEPVKVTEGEYTNIKVTTPEDMAVAEAILQGRTAAGGSDN